MIEHSESFIDDMNWIGFDTDPVLDGIVEVEEVRVPNFLNEANKQLVRQEFSEKNRLVELELEQYFDDSITMDELRKYLEDNITNIYGQELKRLNAITPEMLVDSYLEYNEFEGVRSYMDFTQNIEDIILILREGGKRDLSMILKN